MKKVVFDLLFDPCDCNDPLLSLLLDAFLRIIAFAKVLHKLCTSGYIHLR